MARFHLLPDLTHLRLLFSIRLMRDYMRISRSGVFMTQAYGRRYFGNANVSKIRAIWHYLLWGERRGAWANPFFDPARVHAGLVPPLAKFLSRSGTTCPDPGPYFDVAAYQCNMPAGSTQNPLAHFWAAGFAMDLDPSARFHSGFFKAVIGPYRLDKRQLAYEKLATATPTDPFTENDLVERQDCFRAAITVDELTERPPSNRKWLVFVQASHNAAISFLDDDRCFDVLVNFYDQAPEAPCSAEYAFVQFGTKTTAIDMFLRERPRLLLDYDAVLFLDDDVEISCSEIDRLFEIFEFHQLDLAQPALSEESATYFSDLKQPSAGAGVKPVTAVEIMAPVLSRRALETCGWVFHESISGWGADLLLASEVKRQYGQGRVALIADVVATHIRPVDTQDGAFYRLLAGFGLEPFQELARISWRYGISIEYPSIRFSSAE